ncbi:MAG: Cyclic phosphodiesterase-like protein [Actinomycetota bacterium]|jgi:hypothetical protein
MPPMPKSLWAVPRDPSPFAEWIARLAARTGGPVFAPHITLSEADPPTAPFSVELLHLADSDERFRCITITAARTPPLDGVAAPHLSLLYGELTAQERAALRAAVDLPLPMTIDVDELWVVDTSDDVEKWSVTEKRRLVTS